MELSKLKWTKNVTPDKDWAYEPYRDRSYPMEIPEAGIFCLGWRPDRKENARKPRQGELILLHQKAKVTHIVELLDDKLYHYGDPDGWVYRVVRTVWVPLRINWNTLPNHKELFGFDILICDGLAHDLEEEGKMPEFHKRWDTEGGLEAFQEFLAKKLSAISPTLVWGDF